MKFSPSPAALSIEIRTSRALCAAVGGIALLALSAIFYATIPLVLRFVLVALAASYAWYSLRLQQHQRGRLSWRDDWVWQPQTGGERTLRLESATLWPGLIVLGFSDAVARKKLTFTLWRDSLDADSARRLRVYLRHLPVFGDAAGT